MDNPPAATKGMPRHAVRIYVAAFNSALDQYKDEARAFATAMSAVKAKYTKGKDGKWHPKKRRDVESGTFIGLLAPEDVAKTFAIPDGTPIGDMHLTLAYVKNPVIEAAIATQLSEFCREYGPIKGKVNAVTVFENGEERALVALFDSPQLPHWRQKLIEALGLNADVDFNHGWIPHITIGYLPPDQTLQSTNVERIIGTEFTFTKLRVSFNELGLADDFEITGSVYREHRAREFKRILFLANLENDPNEDVALVDEARLVQTILERRMSTQLVFVSNPQEIEKALACFDPEDTLVFNWAENLPGWIEGGETATSVVEEAGFAHTASPAGTQRLIFDRGQTFLFLKQLGILTPKFQMIYSAPDVDMWQSYPALIRPNDCHGSEDLAVVESADEARQYVGTMTQKHQLPAILVEYISPAREFSIGLWSDGQTIDAFPIAEANFKALDHDIKDEKDKSAAGPSVNAINIIPAGIDPDLAAKLVGQSKDIFKAIGAKIYFRADWRLYENQSDPICIDVNPEPEVSTESLMGEMAKAYPKPEMYMSDPQGQAGMSFEDLVFGILDRAITYYRNLDAADASTMTDGPQEAKTMADDLGRKVDDALAAFANNIRSALGIKAKKPAKRRALDSESLMSQIWDLVDEMNQKIKDAYMAQLNAAPPATPMATAAAPASTAAPDPMAMRHYGEGDNSEGSDTGEDSWWEEWWHENCFCVQDIYFEPDGTIYVLASRGGALYKMDVEIDDAEEVTLTDPVKVTEDHPELPAPKGRAQSKTSIERAADGKVRWFSISCTAAVNRDHEIDSRKLFDSFATNIEAGAPYPYRTFFHQGKAFRTGQADFVARDGNVLITSGLYDDTDIARAEIAAREKEPNYWGESIGYLPAADPEMLVVSRTLKIPVYTDGVLREISTLPKTSASAPFTRTTQEEVQRMSELNSTQFAAFVKLWGGDEAKARQWLAEHADATNRAIAQSGTITREKGAASQGTTPVAPATPPTPAAQSPVPTAPAHQEIVLDDEAMNAIAQRAIKSSEVKAIQEALTNIQASIEKLTAALAATNSNVAAAQQSANDAQAADQTTRAALQERLTKLERTDEEKHREWLADLPEQRTVVTVRPREVREQPAQPATVRTDAKRVAEETLARMKEKSAK